MEPERERERRGEKNTVVTISMNYKIMLIMMATDNYFKIRVKCYKAIDS